MATMPQIIANRKNSKLSTGPRTREGKASSSSNGKTHGLNSVDPVLPYENREKFKEFLEQYKTEWDPFTGHQHFLVEQMAGARWKLNRLERIEMAMFVALESPEGANGPSASDPDAALARAFLDKDAAVGFARLDRYRASLERTYHRCAREYRADFKFQVEAKVAEMLAERRVAEQKLLAASFRGEDLGLSGSPFLRGWVSDRTEISSS